MNNLEWTSVADKMPEVNSTVLVWIVASRFSVGWTMADWDGTDWRDYKTDLVISENVTHWTVPAGPI
jgi:hypothetical protein